MPQVLYVVSRDRTDLYRRLLDELAGEGGVEVILDRRRGERRRGERRLGGGRGLPGRRRGGRRRCRPELEERLTKTGFLSVSLCRGATAS